MNGRSLSALFVLVILVGFVYTEDVPIAADLKNTPCAPGDYFQIDCNTCYCNMERTGYLCTVNSCPELDPVPSSSASPTVSKKSILLATNHNANDNNLSSFPTSLDHRSHNQEKNMSHVSTESSEVKNTERVQPSSN